MPYPLDYNERIALRCAMSLVLYEFDYDVTPEVAVEEILAEDSERVIVWEPFENMSKDDVYNIVWNFQETIYEAMCASDFTQGIRSEFTKTIGDK